MSFINNLLDVLLSLPPAAIASGASAGGICSFAGSDPVGRHLGSGGGTANLLHDAWRNSGLKVSFDEWIACSRKLIIHGSGQSRRLPAYAAEGKPMMPLPILPSMAGQRCDQTLLDWQCYDYSRIFRNAPDSYRVMVTCGDVLVRSDAWIPAYPDADVLIVGLQASPEEASNHGVMFSKHGSGGEMAFFLQKPSPSKINSFSSQYAYLLDTGIWLLSARAVSVLMRKCGWDADSDSFPLEGISSYDMFGGFAEALGDSPASPDSEVGALSCAILPLPNGRFYHFGTNRSVFASIAQLSVPAEGRRSFGQSTAKTERNVVVLHSSVETDIPDGIASLLIENSFIPRGWSFGGDNIVTGIPENDWTLNLGSGICLDIIGKLGIDGMALRVYGFDDTFSGALGDKSTRWCGFSAMEWFAAHGIGMDEAGLDSNTDIQAAHLFPVIDISASYANALVSWMTEKYPADNPQMRSLWLSSLRVSAADIVASGDVKGRVDVRAVRIADAALKRSAHDWESLSNTLDFEACANTLRGGNIPAGVSGFTAATLPAVHLSMFRDRLSGGDGSAAFAAMREMIVAEMALLPVKPERDSLEDQIVWARSPARLDIAGGWTDTPPYCIEHGGRVVNVAVNLNGQPPIQAFARVCEKPELVIHSIDLGIGERISTYEELLQPSALGGFSVARAAFRLAGFDPRFNLSGGAKTLRKQLERDFGGGIELNMLAAIPKGSGLGTSSILSGTILGALGNICGLHWSDSEIYARTSALEQILTSGGGWQDQIGGLSRGLKLIVTRSGIGQDPELRWLPHSMLADAMADGRAMLYYTGITRVARNILGEIVRGIFLNDRRRIGIIEEIGVNAGFAADSIQRQNWTNFREAVRRSWVLNQALDAGTNPPSVARVFDRIGKWNPSVKLLGAGGGGYMLILANDVEEATRIKAALVANPINSRSRFVNVGISETGLQLTRS